MKSQELAPLREAAALLVPKPVGRQPVLSLLGHGTSRPQLDDNKFRAQVGVPSSNAASAAPEWAM